MSDRERRDAGARDRLETARARDDHPDLPSPAAAAVDFLCYARYVTQGAWVAARVHRFVVRQLERLARGEVTRLVISLPPGTGKSMLIARLFAAWWLGTHPSDKVNLVSLSDRHTRKWGRQARDDFHEHAPTLWGLDTWARGSAGEWDVMREGRRTGGSMASVGIGGALMGRRSQLGIMDDVYRSAKEARDVRRSEEYYEWFQGTFLTRLEPGTDGHEALVIILMTRFAENDIIGRLEADQKRGRLGTPWEFLSLPALAEDGDPLGRAVGDPLWPEKYPLKNLLQQKADTPAVWEPMYQGRPTPKEGKIFKRTFFPRYERTGNVITIPGRGEVDVSRPMGDGASGALELVRFVTVDLAASKRTEADYSVWASWVFVPRWRVLVLVDLFRDHLSKSEISNRFYIINDEFAPSIMYLERLGPFLEKHLGSLAKELQRGDETRAGLPVVEVTPSTDKIQRAIAIVGTLATAVQVWFPADGDRAWWPTFLREMLIFHDETEHDDQVDVVTMAVGIFLELLATWRDAEPRDVAEQETYLPRLRGDRDRDGRRRG